MKKHIVLPAVLLVYLGVMAYMSRDLILVSHKYLQYFGTIAAELAVITALYFFLKQRARLRKEREDDIRRADGNQQNNKTFSENQK